MLRGARPGVPLGAGGWLMGFRARPGVLCGRAAENTGVWGPLAPILAFPWDDARTVALRDGRETCGCGHAIPAPSLPPRFRKVCFRREGCAPAGGLSPSGRRLP